MKIFFALFCIITVFAIVHAQEQQPTDDQLIIQALQGQIQFFSAQSKLDQRTIQQLRAQLKDCKPEAPKP